MTRQIARAREMLTFEEKRTTYLYTDTEGNVTGGIGHNFTVKGMPEQVVDVLFHYDLIEAYKGAAEIFPTLPTFDDVRILALVAMVFQMGAGSPGRKTGVRAFDNMIQAIGNGDWTAAAHAALSSRWARVQSPERAKRVAVMLETGRFPYPVKS